MIGPRPQTAPAAGGGIARPSFAVGVPLRNVR